jgi:hypothetical protein
LFARLIGPAFERLPAVVRRVHDGRAERVALGRCDIERGRGAIASLMARATALPAAGRGVPVHVTIRSDAHAETWTREFDGVPMRSTLKARDGLLEERLGLVLFRFALTEREGGIDWTVVGVRALGIPLPAAWFAAVTARESADGALYRFDVRAELPVVGLLVHYRGTLDVEA